MKMIEPSVEVIREPDMAKRIEIAARCCYKSEDKITDGSAMKMVQALIRRGHESPLEHSNIVVATYTPLATNALQRMITTYEYETGVPAYIRNSGSWNESLNFASPVWSGNLRAWRSLAKRFRGEPLFKMLFMNHPLFEDIFAIHKEDTSVSDTQYEAFNMYHDPSQNASLNANNLLIVSILNPSDTSGVNHLEDVYSRITMLDHCESINADMHQILTVRIIADRGVQNELVRHRLLSPSVESTRYCNYGGGLTCIEPWWYPNASESETAAFTSIMNDSESDYDYMQNNIKSPAPQKSRAVLPLATKSEGVYTGTVDYWKKHIIPLRKSAAAHPDMRRVMEMLCKEMGWAEFE